jgi:hypothetical protein
VRTDSEDAPHIILALASDIRASDFIEFQNDGYGVSCS